MLILYFANYSTYIENTRFIHQSRTLDYVILGNIKLHCQNFDIYAFASLLCPGGVLSGFKVTGGANGDKN